MLLGASQDPEARRCSDDLELAVTVFWIAILVCVPGTPRYRLCTPDDRIGQSIVQSGAILTADGAADRASAPRDPFRSRKL